MVKVGCIRVNVVEAGSIRVNIVKIKYMSEYNKNVIYE